jgi:hypothetical protein
MLIAALVLGAVYIWSGVKEDLISQGYNTAVTEYQVKMLEQHNRSIKDTEGKLILLRANLQIQYDKNLQRVSSEREVDTKVITNTEFIEKEVYIENTCNTVDPDLILMFNKSINGVNTSEQY